MTPLAEAVIRSGNNVDTLSTEIRSLGNYEIEDRSDAALIAELLKRQSIKCPVNGEKPQKFPSALLHLATQATTKEAVQEFAEHGLPEVRRLLMEAMACPEDSWGPDFILMSVLAWYRELADVHTLIGLAQSGFQTDAYGWATVLRQFEGDHPHTELLLHSLSDPLPDGFLAVALLDLANARGIQGRLGLHLFDSEIGEEKLAAWLESDDVEDYSYAHSATASTPFLAPDRRSRLLALAYQHPEPRVRMEAAWAKSKAGDQSGLDDLKVWCLDVNYSVIAAAYLKELGAVDAVPSRVHEPDFAAMAEMANWLAHPNEYGRPPDSIRVFDTRELYWPPTDDRRTMWLIECVFEDEEQDKRLVGLVGSITFGLNEAKPHLTPQDLYAHYCEFEYDWCDPMSEKPDFATCLQLLKNANPGF